MSLAGRKHALRRRPIVAACVLLIVLAAASAGPVAAAQPFGITRDFNWAYAAAYGTGRYELGRGDTITIARLPLYWTVREAGSARSARRCRCGLTVLLPVTIGVENLDLENLPHHADELGFFPGVEFELPRTPRWTLKVTGQIGAGAREDGARETAQLYGAGLRSRYAWPRAPGKPAFIGGLYWSGYRPESGELHTLARFSTGAEFDVPAMGWKFRHEPMRLMPHVLADWYFDPVDIEPILSGNGAPSRVRLEWEIGLAAGREQPFSVFGVKFDRVGVAFRFSEHSHGLRLFFGSIF